MNKRKKTLFIYIGTIILSMLIGGAIGGFMGDFAAELSTILGRLAKLLRHSSLYLMLAGGGICHVLSFCCYRRGCEKLRHLGPDDEDTYNAIDKDFNLTLGWCGVGMIITMVFAAIGLTQIPEELADWELLSGLAFMIILLISMTMLQRRCVERVKEMSPEKKGDALSAKFNEIWIDSCDEQEKLTIYRSGYRAFRAVTRCIPLFMAAAMLIGIVTDVGVLPFLMLGGIWLIQTVVYIRECMK